MLALSIAFRLILSTCVSAPPLTYSLITFFFSLFVCIFLLNLFSFSSFAVFFCFVYPFKYHIVPKNIDDSGSR